MFPSFPLVDVEVRHKQPPFPIEIKNLSLMHCVVNVWTELVPVLLEAVRVNLRANSPRRLIRHPNPNPHTTPRFLRL